MIYIIIIILLSLSLYTYFFYKNKGFILYSKYWLPYIFLFLAFLLSFISFFSYQFNSLTKIKSGSSDIVFVLDVSSSMLAQDYNDKSRLEVAKEYISNYIINNLSNRYALSIFAWDWVNLLPLTTDKGLFSTFLESADEKSILKWWTNLLDALNMVSLRFNDSPNGGAIILISDFETNLDSQSKENLVKKILQLNNDFLSRNIKIIFIWVWKKTWNKIQVSSDLFWNKIYKKDKFNNEIITKFDETFFNSFSFQKYKINSISDIWNINIKEIPISDKNINININTDISRYFMILAFLFFMIYLVLFSYFEKKWK